jgi:RNA polymerase sigma-70 factor (sigma-E family)
VSFEEFVSDRLDALLRYATVLCCDPHLAQDVVQEALVRAQLGWTRIGAMQQHAAYVKRMVTNEYLSWRRRKARRDVALSNAEFTGQTDPIADYDERDAMLAGIARLPRKQRAAVVLRYYEGCEDLEIAEILGCSVSTVRSQISRAVAALRVTRMESAR